MGTGASCNSPPFVAGLDSGLIPDREGMMTGEWRQHDLESRQPFGIHMTVTDEDLRALRQPWSTPILSAE